MTISRQSLRERSAGALGLFIDLGVPANNAGSNVSATFSKIADLAVDDERFRWRYLHNVIDSEFRLLTTVVASTGVATVQRAFSNNISNTKTCGIYGTLSPDDWNNLISNDVLPSLYYKDRLNLTLTSGQTEYNATASASWLTSVDQIIRFRWRDVAVSTAPIEREATPVSPYTGGDGIVKLNVPEYAYSSNTISLIIEARHYYANNALSTDAATVGAPDPLIIARAKWEALKHIFQELGPAAKRIYGQQMVLVEREVAEQEKRFQSHSAARDYTKEDTELHDEPASQIGWGW